MKQHAFLIAAHQDPQHLSRLIDVMNSGQAHFFVHIDRKVSLAPFQEHCKRDNVTFIDNRIKVSWGGWSQVQATLNMMIAASESNVEFSYYTLMSGTHFPLKPARAIYDFVEQSGHEMINIVSVPNVLASKGLDRFTKFHVDGASKRNGKTGVALSLLCRAVNALPRKFAPPLPGWTPYAGSSWWTLSSAAVSHILRSVREHPELIRFFKYKIFSDESFFQTILGNSEFRSKCSRADVYTDWSNPKSAPCFLDLHHLDVLLSKDFKLDDCYGTGPANYARKLGNDNLSVVNAIQEYIEPS